MNERQLKNYHIVYEIDKLKNKADQLAIVAPILMDETTWVAEPHVEFPVANPSLRKKPFRIDLYYPSIKLAIEVDEKEHGKSKNKKSDDLREAYIRTKLGCKFIRVKLYKKNLLHVDSINKIKNKIIELSRKVPKWSPKLFSANQALKDHPNLIFVSKAFDDSGRQAFPNFQLASKYHYYPNLIVALISDSKSNYDSTNLKIVDSVFQITNIKKIHGTAGYISWSGIPVSHSISLSGQTSIKLHGTTYHKLK